MSNTQQKDPEFLFRAFLNEREATGRTALFMAVEVNRPKALETLIAFKADPNIPNDQGVTPLQLACDKGYQTCIRVLVRGGCNCSIKPTKNDLITIIFKSIPNIEERAEIMAYLLINGALIDEKQLEKLISGLPEPNQPTFHKAILEARKLRAKNMTCAIGKDAPLPAGSDPTQAAPMDTISMFAGFNTPLEPA